MLGIIYCSIPIRFIFLAPCFAVTYFQRDVTTGACIKSAPKRVPATNETGGAIWCPLFHCYHQIEPSDRRSGLNFVQVGEFILSEGVIRFRITCESKEAPSVNVVYEAQRTQAPVLLALPAAQSAHHQAI